MSRILIVVDMQNDFIDGSLGTAEAVATLPNVVKKINNFSGEIYCTLDTHSSDYLQTSEGRHLPVVHCVRGTWGWQLNEEIAAAVGEKAEIIEKPTFGSVELAHILAAKADEIEEIELVGLCTDICVVSNALLLKAVMPEKTIRVDSSCCAGVSAESHEAALQTMRMCQIEVE